MSKLLIGQHGFVHAPALKSRAQTKDSVGWNKVLRLHAAAQKIIGISPHARQSHVAGGLAAGPVRPEGDVSELGPLVLVDRIRIAQLDGVVGETAPRHLIDGDRIDAQAVLGLGLHHDGLPALVEIQDDGGDAVHEVVGLVHIARQPDPETFVERQRQRLRQPVQQLAPIIIVDGVALVVCGNLAEDMRGGLREEGIQAKCVDQSSAAPGAGDDRGLVVGAFQEMPNILRGGLMVAGPGLVLPTKIPQHAAAFLPGKCILAQVHELAEKRIAAVPAPDMMQRHLEDEPPLWVLGETPLIAIRWRKLPLVASQNQTGHLGSRTPHLIQAAEVLFHKLESLVDDDQVIGGKDAQGLGQRLMEEERAMARVHLDVRMALPHPSSLHPCRQGYQHAGAQANGPPKSQGAQ